MAPLLVSALVGVGVKLATDLLVSGAKQWFRGGSTQTAGAAGASGSTFAATLGKLRGDSAAAPAQAAAPMTASAGTTAIDVGLADRSRVAATEAGAAAVPSGAHAVAAYRRFDQIEAP